MALAWRLCREPFADLAGEGARRYGGRWNTLGHPMVYAAANAALAVLEVRVHLDLPLDLLPDDFTLVAIDLDDLQLEMVPEIPADPAGLATPGSASGARRCFRFLPPLFRNARTSFSTRATLRRHEPVSPVAGNSCSTAGFGRLRER